MPTAILDDEDVGARTGNIGENRDPSQAINPRDLAMEAIEAGRIRDFEATERVTVPAIPDIDPDADPDDVAAELERARLEAVANGTASNPARTTPTGDDQVTRQMGGDPVVIEDPSNVMVKRKVNGTEELVPLAQVLRDHQVNTAADARLEEASRLLREAQARTTIATPAPEATPAAEPGEDVQAIAKGITSALFSGDEAKAEELLVEALTARSSSQTPAPVLPSVDVLAQQVQQQLEVNRATEQFAKDYSRLREDPDLVNMVNRRIGAKTQAGVPMSQAILDAGRELYEQFGWSTPVSERPGNTTTTRRAEKLAAKEALDTVPARSLAASTASDENTPETVSDTIAAMRKARGQI